MPKQQVNGRRKGDPGKRLAGQKRDPENPLVSKKGEKRKRLATEIKMQGADGMVNTRALSKEVCQEDTPLSSKSDEFVYKMFLQWAKKNKKKYKTADEKKKRFKNWCSSKKYLEKKHSHEPGYVLPLDRLNGFADWTNSEFVKKMGGGVIVADDPYAGNRPTPQFYESKLGKKVAKAEASFDKWVAKHKRNYGSERERKTMFWTFYRNKTMIDGLNIAYLGSTNYGYDYDFMDGIFTLSSLIDMLNKNG